MAPDSSRFWCCKIPKQLHSLKLTLEAQVPIVGPWVIDSMNFYRDLRTGTQYIGNWASRVT